MAGIAYDDNSCQQTSLKMCPVNTEPIHNEVWHTQLLQYCIYNVYAEGFGGSEATLGHHGGPKGWKSHFCVVFARIVVSFWGPFWTSFLKIFRQSQRACRRSLGSEVQGEACVILAQFW